MRKEKKSNQKGKTSSGERSLLSKGAVISISKKERYKPAKAEATDNLRRTVKKLGWGDERVKSPAGRGDELLNFGRRQAATVRRDPSMSAGKKGARKGKFQPNSEKWGQRTAHKGDRAC